MFWCQPLLVTIDSSKVWELFYSLNNLPPRLAEIDFTQWSDSLLHFSQIIPHGSRMWVTSEAGEIKQSNKYIWVFQLCKQFPKLHLKKKIFSIVAPGRQLCRGLRMKLSCQSWLQLPIQQIRYNICNFPNCFILTFSLLAKLLQALLSPGIKVTYSHSNGKYNHPEKNISSSSRIVISFSRFFLRYVA